MQVLPSFGSIRFSCPLCGALAHQYWGKNLVEWRKKDGVPLRVDKDEILALYEKQKALPEEERFADASLFPEYGKMADGDVFQGAERCNPYSYHIYNVDVSRCESCNEIAIWIQDRMVHPSVGPAVFANNDMPATVKSLFVEAGAVFATSPRASAALLRLAMQLLLKELGEKGDNINSDIESLFEKGLSPSLTKVMHSLRIIGNESVHPGQISVDDNPSIAEAMFGLLNEIVEQLITRKRVQEELWAMLPEAKRKPVEEKLKKKNGDGS